MSTGYLRSAPRHNARRRVAGLWSVAEADKTAGTMRGRLRRRTAETRKSSWPELAYAGRKAVESREDGKPRVKAIGSITPMRSASFRESHVQPYT